MTKMALFVVIAIAITAGALAVASMLSGVAG
jgi:hypothetical protein